MMSDAGGRESPRLSQAVPVQVIGRRDPSLRFGGVAVGLSENGFGMRARDEALSRSTIEALLRQPVVCRFDLPDVTLGEIAGRVIRIEPSRRDLRYHYFLAVEFLEISAQDQMTLRGLIRSYEERKQTASYPNVD
jgi:hypothetical protein